MSNTDGEDTQQKYSKEEIKALQRALSHGYKECKQNKNLDRCSFGYETGVLITGNDAKYLLESQKELASLREQLATEQDMRSTAEFANRMIIKDLNEKLKQKEDENRELREITIDLLSKDMFMHEYPYTSKKLKELLGIPQITIKK